MTKKLFFSIFFLLVLAVGSSGYAKQTEIKDLPVMLQSLISEKMGEDNPAYQVQGDGDLSYVTKNPKHGLTMKVCPEGMTVQSEGGLNWGTKLKDFGLYKKIVSRSNRIDVEFGDITEWFINGPSGIEQGWTLRRNTSSHSGNKDAEEIIIQLAQSGNTLVAAAAARDLEVKKEDGSVFLRYGGLFAHDAEGKELEAQFDMADGDILIRVDGRNAVYPVTIDPYVQTAKLTASVPISGEQLGSSVAISSDGMVVAVGATGPVDAAGRVFVFQKTGTTWAQSQILTASGDGTSWQYLGGSVAISDGYVIAAGADKYGVCVFVKTGATWAQSAILKTSNAYADRLGRSVAINGDGSVVAAGAIYYSNSAGGVFVFEKGAEGAWPSNTQTAILKASGEPGEDILGDSVAISNNGRVVAAGASGYDDGSAIGRVCVFEKGETLWPETQTAILGGTIGLEFGRSVAISSDGSVVAVGAPSSNDSTGEVYVFKKGNTWTNSPQAKLTASDGNEDDYLGVSVAISSDGSVVAAGASGYPSDAGTGRVCVFERAGATWVNNDSPAILSASDGAESDGLGSSVSISIDGSVVAGAPYGTYGAAYVFGSSTPPDPPVPAPDPPAPCSLSISPFNPSLTGDAGTTTYNVSNAVGYTNVSWTASVWQGGDWFTITSGASGTDSGTITCSFTANPSTAVARVAYIGIVPSDGLCQGRLGIMVTQNPLSASATLLWTKTDGTAWVWPLDATGLPMGYGRTYGPFTGWTADSYHREVGSEGTAQMLWNHINGTASIQFMNDMGDMVNMEYGPEAGWTAVRYHLNSNGTAQMLWNHTDGTASVWTLNVRGIITAIPGRADDS